MARTAPAPNIPPIPGMCPSIAVMGGGGGGGGGSGDGSGDGSGNGGPNGDGSADGASGDQKNGGCSEGDPVCPITGRVVLTLFDFGFGGPLPLRWMRAYSSRASRHAGELGHGWSHTFGWRVRVKRSEVVVFDDWNRVHTLERPLSGDSRSNGAGLILTATRDSFVATKLDERLTIEFGPLCDDGFHYMSSYLWNRESLAQEVDELTGRVRTYIRAPNRWQPIGHVDSLGGAEKAYLYVEGPSGGVERVVDEKGAVVWSAELSVYGDASLTKSDLDISLRYTNQFYDEDVGLTYNRFRWFDARLGVYVTPDPWLLRGTLAPRNYVDNPLVQFDPRGLMPHPGVGTPSNMGASKKKTHHPSPGVPGNPGRPGDVDAMDDDYMSSNGHWSRPDLPPPGTDEEPAGFANCPEGALDKGSGFGTGPKSAQGIVDRAGDTYGCHSCGSKDSGWTSKGEAGGQHWTCDHVPPRSTYKPGTDNHTTSRADAATGQSTAVRLYPHCRNCAARQGGLMSHMSDADRATIGESVMDGNT